MEAALGGYNEMFECNGGVGRLGGGWVQWSWRYRGEATAWKGKDKNEIL